MRYFVVMLLISTSLALVLLRSRWLCGGGGDVAPIEEANDSPIVDESLPEVAAIARRIAAKLRVIDQLLAGELDLFRAAACVREIDLESPTRNSLADFFPGKTEEERRCRQVISWVEVRGRDTMDRREVERRIADLESVLAARLREDARFTLP
jgi:hypothetical protein